MHLSKLTCRHRAAAVAILVPIRQTHNEDIASLDDRQQLPGLSSNAVILLLRLHRVYIHIVVDP